MKFPAPFAFLSLALTAGLCAADVPKIFSGIFEQDVPVRGQIGVVLPPPEIDKYVAKVESASKQDLKWFREYSANAKPGAPLPYDKRLGLTEKEYEEYLALWGKRDFKPIEDVMLLLRQSAGGTWTVTATGNASTFSTLRYDPKKDVFRSPNGEMARIEDIKADATSILGAWTGKEWKFEEETGLGKIKENFALGQLTKKGYGIIVYRAQEMSSEGTKLLDKSLVVRFILGKAGQVKLPPPGAKPPARR